MLEDIKYLKVNLPEDVLNLKANGNFKKALEVIDIKLNNNVSKALRKRLELEKYIIKVLEGEYIYSYEEALEILQQNIANFKEEELIELKDKYLADWIYKEGKVYFIDSFFSSLLVTQKHLNDRLIVKEDEEVISKRQKFLDDNVVNMKEKGKVAYEIHLKVTLRVKEECVEEGNVIKVHLPVPTNGIQVKNVKILNTYPEAKVVAPFDYEQRTVYFEEVAKQGQEFIVEYSYETHMTYNELDYEKAIIKDYDFDINELEPHICFTPYIKELCEEVVGDEKNPLIKARKIYDFITTNVTYSYVRKYFTILNIPEYAGINLKGDCGIQALLFITMCRCVGVPAKWQSGLYVTPQRTGAHDWAQFYVEPYGWVFADLSFGGSAHRLGKTDRWNFYFGNLDPFRMPANSEFQHEFNPPKKHLRVDPYDNQYGECEYEHRGLMDEEYTTENKLVSMKEIVK